MRPEPTRPLWHCPPQRTRTPGKGPWCDGLPCHGHRATSEQRTAARVLAWAEGELLADLAGFQQQQWMTTARLALHESGPGLGVPR